MKEEARDADDDLYDDLYHQEYAYKTLMALIKRAEFSFELATIIGLPRAVRSHIAHGSHAKAYTLIGRYKRCALGIGSRTCPYYTTCTPIKALKGWDAGAGKDLHASASKIWQGRRPDNTNSLSDKYEVAHNFNTQHQHNTYHSQCFLIIA
eukprot:6198716-Pleurochrysis_carterae.AAC.3